MEDAHVAKFIIIRHGVVPADDIVSITAFLNELAQLKKRRQEEEGEKTTR